MAKTDATYTSVDGTLVPAWLWASDDIRGTVIIIHGMAEHAGRYDRFAGALNQAGLAVYAPDLRGHGRAITQGIQGSFDPGKGGCA